MISFETAMRLKEVGFPQPIITERHCKFSGYLEEGGIKADAPALPELIEKCMAGRDCTFHLDIGKNSIQASILESNTKKNTNELIRTYEKTPEEAVAALFISLVIHT